MTPLPIPSEAELPTKPIDSLDPDLLSCPFCKGPGEMRTWHWPYVRYRARCSVCHIGPVSRLADRNQAAAAWNARPPGADADAGVGLRGALVGLTAAAMTVHHLGATPGSQWSRLAEALGIARTLLKEKEPS